MRLLHLQQRLDGVSLERELLRIRRRGEHEAWSAESGKGQVRTRDFQATEEKWRSGQTVNCQAGLSGSTGKNGASEYQTCRGALEKRWLSNLCATHPEISLSRELREAEADTLGNESIMKAAA